MATLSTGNGTTPDAADVAAQIEALKADIAALSTSVAGYAAGKGAEVRDRAAIEAERLGQEAARVANQAGDMVRERPGAALGVAAALGFVVGFLMSRR